MDMLGSLMFTSLSISTVKARVLEISSVIFRMLVAVLSFSFSFSFSFELSIFSPSLVAFLPGFGRLSRFKLVDTDLKKSSTLVFVCSLISCDTCDTFIKSSLNTNRDFRSDFN